MLRDASAAAGSAITKSTRAPRSNSSAGGDSNPVLETRNVRFRVLCRRQWRRPWRYYGIEANYALRKDTEEETRKWYPGLVLRLEVMLARGLIR